MFFLMLIGRRIYMLSGSSEIVQKLRLYRTGIKVIHCEMRINPHFIVEY